MSTPAHTYTHTHFSKAKDKIARLLNDQSDSQLPLDHTQTTSRTAGSDLIDCAVYQLIYIANHGFQRPDSVVGLTAAIPTAAGVNGRRSGAVLSSAQLLLAKGVLSTFT